MLSTSPKATDLPPFGQASNLLAGSDYRLLMGASGQAEAWLVGGLPISAPNPEGQILAAGRRFWLHDLDSQAVWELTAGDHSTEKKLESPAIRQLTIGSTVANNQAEGITSQLETTISSDGQSEIWRLTLVNNSGNRRRLAIFAVFNPPVDSYQTQRTEFKEGLLTLHDTRRVRPTIFICSEPVADSFDSDHQLFYDRSVLPSALIEGKCNRTLTKGRPAVMVLQKNLALSSTSKFLWQVNYGFLPNHSIASTAEGVKNWRRSRLLKNPPQPNQWLERLRWPAVSSPDPVFDAAINKYWKYQALIADNSSPSTAVTGQAVALSASSGSAVEDLIKLLSRQSSDGSLGDYDGADSPDGDAWLVFGLINYWQETGDWSLVDRQVGYRSGGTASVASHFSRALASCLATVCGVEGRLLPEATLSSTAMAYRAGSSALAVFQHLGDGAAVEKYQRLIANLPDQFERQFWTGRRYRLTVKETGLTDQPFIALEAILAGLAPSNRAKKQITELTAQALKMTASQNDLVSTIDVVRLIEANLLLGDSTNAWRLLMKYYPGYYSVWPAGLPYGFWPSSVTSASHPLPGLVEFDRADYSAGALYRALTEKLIGVAAHFGGLKIDPHLPKDWRRVEYSRRFRDSNYHIRLDNPLRVSQGVERIVVDGLRLTGQTIPPRGGGDHYVEVVLG